MTWKTIVSQMTNNGIGIEPFLRGLVLRGRAPSHMMSLSTRETQSQSQSHKHTHDTIASYSTESTGECTRTRDVSMRDRRYGTTTHTLFVRHSTMHTVHRTMIQTLVISLCAHVAALIDTVVQRPIVLERDHLVGMQSHTNTPQDSTHLSR
jgi:hypothetical protein